jgi:GNAT superfamily N-acetyltransferase
MQNNKSDIIIREGHESDLPEIIRLMKSSLGEELMPKSENFFKWKHLQNPFGASEILLALHKERIVGLRTFMYWRWEKNSEGIRAVRAVDTATAKDFQGKGIFRDLTLRAADICKDKGVSMVFNTPNPISKQGYLKMGWHEAGRMPFFAGPGSIFPKRAGNQDQIELLKDFDIATNLAAFPKDWKHQVDIPYYHTPISFSYIHWRYSDCPVATYGMMGEPDIFGIIFRMKPWRGFLELRICESWILPGRGNEKRFHAAYRHIIKKLRPILVTSAPSAFLHGAGKPSHFLLGPFRKGPMVTIRPLSMENLKEFDNFNAWRPSIGTLELF